MNMQVEDYPENDEPYFLFDDTGYGKCPQCGSSLELWGVVSMGDGDLCDEIGCPMCQRVEDYINCIEPFDD